MASISQTKIGRVFGTTFVIWKLTETATVNMGDSPAERLLKRFGVEQPSQIDLEAIAFELGALVVYDQLVGCDARIVGKGKRAIITVSSKSSPERQRFSLGHEIAHWVDGWHGVGFLCGKADIGEAVAIDA